MRAQARGLQLLILALLVLTAPAKANAMHRWELQCPDDPDASLAALCLALRERLDVAGHQIVPQGGDGTVALQGRNLGRAGLAARLVVTLAGRQNAGPELMLTVMDRPDIPQRQLLRFADDLITGAAPFLP